MISLKERLTEILINNKLLTPEQLDQALELQKTKGGKLSDIIVELHFIKESDLISALSEGLGFPLIDLKRFRIDPAIAKIIPASIAKHYQIIPVSKMGDTITLAMADPLNIFAIDHVGSLTGYKINPIISSLQDINQTVEAAFPDSTGGVIDDLVKEMAVAPIELVKEEQQVILSDQELNKISRQTPVIKITYMILEQGVKKKASDILVEPLDKKMRIRFRIDGILQEEQAPPRSMHASIISRIKVMSDLDVAEHRLPQDGRFKVKMFGREIDFRISILPSSFGEKAAIRILDKSQATLDIDKLGFNKVVVYKVGKLARQPHGMILVTGPTGSGKTTTLYSVLKLVDSPEKNIITVEDPVEFQIEGINQVTIRPEIGLTFAGALRSILRQDPNVIMIGEIRDFETVDIAIKSALTGHLVTSTLHTTTASGAVARLINMGVEPYLINSSLICVIAQRLVRKICPYCKEEQHISEDVLKTLKINYTDLVSLYENSLNECEGIDLAKIRQSEPILNKTSKPKIYKGKGCSHCFNLGYRGRIGIAEMLILTPAVRDLVLKRAQEHIIKKQARLEGMITLREDGMIAVLNGLTTLEEVLRVTAPDEDK
ncbi:MAG: secretion system protein E [Candidatus Omnitrophota bacterium]|jgi:type IV pilus assembly protein PilB|nr:MAG: secretion system protein E [Candidatus Omnitrophota bacterium]